MWISRIEHNDKHKQFRTFSPTRVVCGRSPCFLLLSCYRWQRGQGFQGCGEGWEPCGPKAFFLLTEELLSGVDLAKVERQSVTV
jgi:hypothetical protein